MLGYYAYLARKRRVTEQEVKMLSKSEISLRELKELQELEREDLLALMKFCDIRTYEDTPVMACDDNELRMAYILWRSREIQKRKRTVKSLGRRFREYMRYLEQYKSFMG